MKIISTNIFGNKNKPSPKQQLKFKAIEEGTFNTRDLVSEPGNILYARFVPWVFTWQCYHLIYQKFNGLTNSITFAATVNSMILSGGKFNLIDIDKRSFNSLDTNKLTKKLENKKSPPDLIIPVHFAGQSADMKKQDLWKT